MGSPALFGPTIELSVVEVACRAPYSHIVEAIGTKAYEGVNRTNLPLAENLDVLSRFRQCYLVTSSYWCSLTGNDARSSSMFVRSLLSRSVASGWTNSLHSA